LERVKHFFTEIRFKPSSPISSSGQVVLRFLVGFLVTLPLSSLSVCTLAGNLHLTLPAGSQTTMAALVHQIFCEFFCTFFDIFLRI
jgi:hypothetical protein